MKEASLLLTPKMSVKKLEFTLSVRLKALLRAVKNSVMSVLVILIGPFVAFVNCIIRNGDCMSTNILHVPQLYV